MPLHWHGTLSLKILHGLYRDRIRQHPSRKMLFFDCRCSLKLESQDTLNAFAWVSILGALNVSPQVSLRGLIDPTYTAIGLSEDCFNVASYSNNKVGLAGGHCAVVV